MSNTMCEPSTTLRGRCLNPDAFNSLEGSDEDYLDLILDSTSSSSSPMSTLFDAEPSRLAWNGGLTSEPTVLPQYSEDLFKEEAFDNFDMTTVPMSTLCNDYMFDTNEDKSSKASFGGLMDFNAGSPQKLESVEDGSAMETPKHRQGRDGSDASTAKVTCHLSRIEMSPTSARSSTSGCASRKRKSSNSNVSVSSRSSLSPPASPIHKKASHNMIEKRYRTNLNDKISALRNAVPSLRAMMNKVEAQGDDNLEDSLSSAQKLSKATILSKATEYIRHLERKNEKLGWENAELKDRVARLETMVLNSVNNFADADTHRFSS